MCWYDSGRLPTLMTAEKADRNDLAYGMITKGLKNLPKSLIALLCF